MSNDVQINLIITDNKSTDKVIKKVQVLKDLLDQTAISAGKINVGGSMPQAPSRSTPAAGGGGSSAAPTSGKTTYSGALSTPSGAAAQAAGASYGATRGTAGSTGSAASDFAEQAQGLSGLVRVYATFAANVYAVSAAFRVLSEAMNTANMVKGLDQLGAASGTNLGALSKRLVQATGNAISLREGMQAVAQASAAGISSENIIKIGEAAKKASQVLGVSMTDAVSRLSRGIVKLEPELLDELGIFTKLGESNKKYALTLGKSAASLTDFEKRQGFANAVLEEAANKFGKIELASNPYDRLLASFKDLAQTGLELANKVLVPIVGILAQSPTALMALIAYIGATLISKTIPALGKWRESLKDAAAAAAANAAKIKESFGPDFQDRLDNSFNLKTLDKNLTLAKDKLESLKKAATTPGTVMPESLKGVKSLEAPDTERTTAQMSSMNKMLEQRKNLITEGSAAYTKASAVVIEAATKEVAYLQQEINKQEELNRARKGVATATGLREAGYNKAEVVAGKGGTLSAEETNKRIYAAALYEQTKYNRMSLVAENTRVMGISGAMGALHTDLVTSGAKTWEKWSQLSKGALISTVTRLSDLASSFGQIGMVVGAAVGAFELASLLFSTNGKEAAEAKEAINNFDSSLINLNKTFEVISEKDPLKQISTESINAKATAINGFIASMRSMQDTTKAMFQTASWFDYVTQGVKAVVKLDVISQETKRFAIGVNKTLASIGPSKAKTETIYKLKDILGVDPQDLEALADKTFSWKVEGRTLDELEKLGHELANVASRGKQLDDAFMVASKTLDTILISAIPTDAIAKLGMESINVGQQMTDAFKDPIVALGQIASISDDISKLRFFGDIGLDLLKMSPEIKKAAGDLTSFSNSIAEVEAQEKVLTDRLVELEAISARSRSRSERRELADLPDQLGGLAAAKKAYKGYAADAETVLAPARALFVMAQNHAFESGAKKIETSIGSAFAQAAITVQTALAAGLGDSIGGIQLKASLQQASIDIQMKQLDSTAYLIDSQEKLRIAQEDQTDVAKKALLLGVEGNKVSPKDLQNQLDAIRDRMAARAEVAKTLARTPGREKISVLRGYSNEAEQIQPSKEDKAFALAKAEAAAAAGPNVFAAQGLEAQRAQKAAEKTAVAIGEQLQIMQAELAVAQRLSAYYADIYTTSKGIFDSETSGLGYLTEQLLLKKEFINELLQQNKFTQENAALAEKVREAEYTRDTTKDAKTKAYAEKTLLALDLQKTQLGNKQENEDKLRLERLRVFEIENAKKVKLAKLDIDKIKSESETATATATVGRQEDRLSTAATLGASTIDPTAIIAAQQLLDIEKESIRNKTVIKSLNDAQSRALAESAAQIDIAGGVGSEGAKQIEDKQAATTAAYNSALANEAALTASKRETGKAISDNNTLLAQQKTAMESLVDVTESLAVVFGTIGQSIGDGMQKGLKAFQDGATKSRAIEASDAQKRADIQADTTTNQMDKIEELAALDKATKKKQTANTIDTYGKEAGAFKGMFKEKTAAYKIFSAFEKAMSIIKLATLAAEVAAEIGLTTVSVAASGTRAGAKGTESIVNAMKDLPTPFNFIAGAAMAALVASLIGGAFSSKSVSIPSVEDRQKAQNTGQTYDASGKLVETGGGVFGDPSAKMGGFIGKALSSLNDNSIDGLYYSSKMTELLSSINDNIGKASSALYGTTGVRSGTLPGVDTSSSSTNMMGQLTNSTIFGALSMLIPGAGLLTMLAANIAGFFLKSNTNREVIDSGLQLSGTFYDLVNAGEGTIKAFNDLKTTTQYKLFGIKLDQEMDVKTITEPLSKSNPEAAAALNTVFAQAGELITQLAVKTGQTVEQVNAAYKTINISTNRVSLIGLQGQALIDETTALIGGAIDTAANVVLASMKKFATIGEELTATAVRVVDANDKISVALASIGIQIPEYAFEVSENLVALSGGLSKFTEDVKYFREHFLSEAQLATQARDTLIKKLGDLTTAAGDIGAEDMITQMLDTMDRAGVAALDTRDSFAKVVASINVTAPAGQILYTRMMDLQEAFDTTASASEKLKDSQNSQMEAYLELEGKTIQATRHKRDVELAGMNTTLRATQKYIYALQDEKTARDAATSAVKNTISSLGGSIKTLTDYQFSLATGAQGVMTPQQKYAALQQDLATTKAAAMGPTDTPAQLAAQQAAAAKLPQAVGAFLTASQAIYASGDQYTQDLSSAQGMLSDTISSLTLTESLAQAQLTTLNTSGKTLASIDTSTISTNQLMYDFTTAASASYVAFGNAFSNPLTMTPDADTALLTAEALQVQKDLLAEIRIANAAAAKKVKDDAAAALAALLANASIVNNQTEALVEAFTDATGRIHYIGRTIGGSGDQKGNLYTNKP